jgi:L-alanine-DL-glutamate epimerase-like enolase superfamily enzyme
VKITNIESIPAHNGFRNYLLVAVHTDEGITGIGESGMSSREMAVAGVIEHWKPVLVGQDPMRIEHLWQMMSRGGFFPARGPQSSALSAIDIALWDITGKALNTPVYQLLGGLARDKLLCYGHIGDGTSVEVMVENALRMKDRGWRALRFGSPMEDGRTCEPRRTVRKSIEYFAALREALGDDVELILDAHTRIDLPEAIQLGRALEEHDPLFLEDPLRSESYEQYAALRPHVHVPIGAGEQATSKWELLQLIENNLVDYCRLDPCLVGGLTESKKIAGWCEVHQIRLAVHNPLGPVSTAACVHFNLSCPNFGIMEQPGMPGIMPEVFRHQMEWKDGYLLPPTRPGLGIEVDLDAARKYPYQPWEPPQTKRLDGGVTNW